MLKAYFCPGCLELGYGVTVKKYYSFLGEQDGDEDLYEVYCPSCNGSVVVAEIPDDLMQEIDGMRRRVEAGEMDGEDVALALILLIATGEIRAYRWIVEDYVESKLEFKPSVEDVLKNYTKDVIIEVYNKLSKRLKLLMLHELL